LTWKLKERILKILAKKKREREREMEKRNKIVPYRFYEIIVKLIIFTIKSMGKDLNIKSVHVYGILRIFLIISLRIMIE
jgi:hypothetical protein